MDIKEQEQEAPAASATNQHQFVKFPEDQIKGDGFTQLDPNTGWLWIGINLNKFNFRSAWAFIKSQEFQVSHYLDSREKQAMVRAQLANAAPKQKAGIVAMAQKLGIKV